MEEQHEAKIDNQLLTDSPLQINKMYSDMCAYMPTVQIKEEHSSFWEKIIIILMQVFLFLYKFVCSIE